jgi:alpha-L-rhamnosidase
VAADLREEGERIAPEAAMMFERSERRSALTKALLALVVASFPWHVTAFSRSPSTESGGDASAASGSALRVADLRCEYRQNPQAIDVPQPRLSWILDSNERGQKQTAYRVLVASDAHLLAKDCGDLWDSGRVESDQTTQVVYAGKPLASRTRCFWSVCVWDKDGKTSARSQSATWTMGLLRAAEWRAKWIRLGERSAATQEPSEGAPSPWLRKTFRLEGKPERATAYVNALGYYELYVNGQKVGDDVLGPAVSDYRSRSFYVPYNIAPLLHKGRNCVALWLGRGWRVTSSPGVQTAGPMVRFQAEMAIGDKTVEIVSDTTWKCRPSPYTTLGPWRYDQFGGERYDARIAAPLWNREDCDDSQWADAEVAAAPGSQSQSQSCPLNRIGQRIPAVACRDMGNGRYEVDFGTALTGWLRMQMPPMPTGQRVVMHYADRRYPTAIPEELPPGVNRYSSDETFESQDGKVRYQTFHQADEFISAGGKGEEFCSKFNYHGFRYVIIEGLPAKPPLDHLEALLIESDLESTGSFACSNELLNRIHRLNLWTIRCLNLGGYLVDCPHRERLGYGDGQVSAESCLMNLWMPNFYAKWLGDWRDGQDASTGNLAHVAPRDNPDGGGGPGWGGSMAALAWRTYLHYGDRRVLEACYEPMRRYVDFLESRCVDGVLRTWGEKWDFIGDWVPPGRGKDTSNWPPARANELFNNCYRVYLWELLEKAASALGRENEAVRCRAKLAEIRPRIHKAFYAADQHTYVLEEQAYQCFPLLVDVVPPPEKSNVLAKLESGILVQCRGHLDSGMLGTYFLIEYLSTIRRDDLLFTMVNQKTYPGWGFMVDQGATTMWEQWNGYSSQIHSCFTSAAGWFHTGLAGIRPDPAAPGFKRIVIRPAVVGDLTWVKSSYRSIHGLIVCNWARKDGAFTLDVTIPANTTATVYVPSRRAQSVTEGGRPADAAEGVKYLRTEDGCSVFVVGGGKYSFASDLSVR